MKFIIQQFGQHWLIKTYLGAEDAQAIQGEPLRDVRPSLGEALLAVRDIAVDHGIDDLPNG